MGKFAQMIEQDYGIIRKGTIKANPQANSVLDRMHQTLQNLLRTFEVHQSDVTAEDS